MSLRERTYLVESRIPKIQYHATSKDRVASIMKKGLSLPRGKRDVSTHWYGVPTISTADKAEYAQVYHPSGVLLKIQVLPGAKYLNRSIRSMKKGENLEQSVDRWIKEAKAAKADGVRVEGMQSTIGNQTINPRVLKVIGVVE